MVYNSFFVRLVSIIKFGAICVLLSLILVQCAKKGSKKDKNTPLFEEVNAETSNVNFVNELTPTEDFNMYIFRNFYNGGGVAIGDVSGDGLPDLFLTGNMTSNRLYINQGDFTFLDVTDQAGLNSEGYWSTGASMADVNGDGRLDIYVTLSGKPGSDQRHNRLYINQGSSGENGDASIPGFIESALEYNLRDRGLSTHGVFFDFNGDSRLDLYLISNSFHEVGNYEDVTGADREIPDPRGASKLYRNDGDSFTDVTQEAGIYSSVLGFGMSATVSDLNRDGLPDLYVANDFFERDYLYMNNGDGTFSESLEPRIRSTSFSSMGSDIADLNNDGWPEIYVTDMLPADETRLKSKMTIESWQEYQNNVSRGFHHKFTRNTLQWNRGDGTFSEIGRYSNVYATDWSWAALIADFNNSGLNDIFVANGIYKDLLDQDYIDTVSDPGMVRRMIESGEEDVILKLMEQMSSTPLSNVVFKNEGNFRFTNQTESWGLEKPGFSTGAAWGDLDNDGDLDLVTNDVNGSAKIYRNSAEKLQQNNNWLKVNFEGAEFNQFGIGAQVQVWADEKQWFREHYLQRGFQSSMEPGVHIGLGEVALIDSVVIRWPNGSISRQDQVEVPATLTFDQRNSVEGSSTVTVATFSSDSPIDSEEKRSLNLDEVFKDGLSQWNHEKYDFSEFDRDLLSVHSRSSEGPALCTGDINGDARTDLYFGGGRGQAGALWIQDLNGGFDRQQSELFENDAISEEVDCSFFDATGNGFDDLYIVSGGHSFSSGSSALSDRFYRNDGTGLLQRSPQILPTTRGFEPGSVVTPHDFTGDGQMDLFVGIRLEPFAVGLPVNGYLLEGDGEGNFTDVTEEYAPQLLNIGMITDALWTDLTGDQEKELVVVGEWMPIHIFKKSGSQFIEVSDSLSLNDTDGWWNRIVAADIDGDGRTDLVGGNHGENSIFKADPTKPVIMFVGDLSRNGMVERFIAQEKNNKYYPFVLRHDIVESIPDLALKYPSYSSYAGETVEEILTSEQLNTVNRLNAFQLKSMIFWNKRDGFEAEPLPTLSQLSPVYGIEITDLNGDNYSEIIFGGNLYDAIPLAGPYDASRGGILSYSNNQLLPWKTENAGLNISGEIRQIEQIDIDGSPHLIILRNGATPLLLKIN